MAVRSRTMMVRWHARALMMHVHASVTRTYAMLRAPRRSGSLTSGHREISPTHARAAAAAAAALARSISRAMTVAFAADDALTTRARFGDVHTRIVYAHVCDDARPVSLQVAHITKSLNITHTRTRRGGGGVGVCSLALAYDGCCDRCRCRIDGASALVMHTRASVTLTCAMIGPSCQSGLLSLRHRKKSPTIHARAAAAMAAALARSLSRAMAVAIAADDAFMARARVDTACARIGDARVRDDVRAQHSGSLASRHR